VQALSVELLQAVLLEMAAQEPRLVLLALVSLMLAAVAVQLIQHIH
jgi:hypothetical protein